MDKYFTKLEIAEQLINSLVALVDLNQFDVIIEPSCGGHAFLHEVHKKLASPSKQLIIGYDVDPVVLDGVDVEYPKKRDSLVSSLETESVEIKRNLSGAPDRFLRVMNSILFYNKNAPVPVRYENNMPITLYKNKREGYLFVKVDFLTTAMLTPTKALVIGNPPFGKNNKLVKAFLNYFLERNNYVLKTGSIVAFVLPLSFKKMSFQKTILKNKWQILKITDLPKNSFIFEGKPVDVPTIFLILKKEEKSTNVLFSYQNLNSLVFQAEAYGITFLKKSQLFILEGDSNNKEEKSITIALQRVGSKAGTVKESNLMNLAETTHYFIKLGNGNQEKLLEIFKNLNIEAAAWTVGAKSLSKEELLLEVIKKIKMLG